MAKSEKKSDKQTPMMEQYWSVRNSLASDTILLFRLGDFYEMFYDDAVEGSRILGITLTKRQNYPMAGIPYHAADQYIPKLLAAGRKVAICDQNEIPKPGQLVKRSLSRILTPGTTIEDSQLDSRHGNFVMALDIDAAHKLYASWLDLSTAEFYCAEFDTPADFLPILSACSPKEIVLPEDASRRWGDDPALSMWNSLFRGIIDITPVTLLHDYRFEPAWGAAQIRETLGVLGLEGFGIARGLAADGPRGRARFLRNREPARASAKPKDSPQVFGQKVRAYRPFHAAQPRNFQGDDRRARGQPDFRHGQNPNCGGSKALGGVPFRAYNRTRRD